MYKPPENTNRVKSIKSKFENIDKSNDASEKKNMCQNGYSRNNLTATRNGLRSTENMVAPLNLQRQLSDPTKRNIKRTPAFRLDKNTEKVAAAQRGSTINKIQEFKHILKPISALKTSNCDSSFNPSEKSKLTSDVPYLTKNNKAILYKSKSSIDFELIRKKFNLEKEDDKNHTNQRNEDIIVKNIAPALYTEPIPKSLRVKTCDTNESKHVYSNLEDLTSELKRFNGICEDIHNSSTLKLTDKNINTRIIKKTSNVSTGDPVCNVDIQGKLKAASESKRKNKLDDNADTNSAMKKLDTLLELTKTNSLKKGKKLNKSEKHIELPSTLTDTLKNALKRPLPTGPAPEKPPRTFEHCAKSVALKADNLERNISFLHDKKSEDSDVMTPLCLMEKSLSKRNDPKYMLNKLETALRNNKLRSKRTAKTDISTTSGEDSDDNILFRNNLNTSATNQNRTLPSVPDNTSLKSNNSSPPSNSLLVQALNFNCLNGYNCVSSPYTKLNESKSSFFISVKNEEPLYAEPWQFEGGLKVRNGPRQRSASSDRNSKNKRNSLYYLSSPVLCGTPRSNSSSNMNVSSNQTDVPSSNPKYKSEKVTSPDILSLSSFTSESAASTPVEEMEKFETSVDIKHLIATFENGKSSLDSEQDDSIKSNGIINFDDIPEKELDDLKHNKIIPHNRLDNLGRNIKETLDSFDNSDLGGDDSITESEKIPGDRKMSIDDPTVSKFRKYVRNVSVYAKTRPQWKKSTLFSCCLIVEWNADVRRIKFKYPYNVQVPHKIEDLCFPDATCGPLDKTTNAQCYSLVITNDKGERTFGYCRRVVPEGSNKCLPIAYCILSKHKSPRFYKKILIELESRHGISELHRNNLLRAFYFNKFPQPGETVVIKIAENVGCINGNKESLTLSLEQDEVIKEEEEKEQKSSLEDSIESSFVIVNDKGEYESLTKSEKEKSNKNLQSNFVDLCEESGDIILNLHHDPIYENSDLKDLHELPADILLKIFASLLLERKVILISCLLSKLSSCVEALQTIIYPFNWPHSFIPVLPTSLWEFVEAPTPIICGILSIEVINKHEIEHGIVVDLDEKCILKEEGDEDKALSTSMLKAWRRGTAAAKNIPSDQEEHSFHLTDAYINMFAIPLKNYRDYIVNGNFQKEAFIRSGKSKGIRRFLKWFTDTTMFLTFVDAVITNSQDFSLFDKKIAMYGSENSGLIPWINF